MRALLLTAALLPACARDWGVSRADLLEAARIDGIYEEDPVPLAGEALVESADAASGDWSFSFGQDLGFNVHSPGRLDLSALHERELSGEVSAPEGVGALALSDGEGLTYAFGYWDPPGLPAGTFSHGDEIGAEDRGYPSYTHPARYTYLALRVEADGGAVELLPGESVFVEIEGQTWNVVHHGSYTLEYRGDSQPKCGGSTDVMAFEVLRVDSAGEDAILARPKGERSLDNDLSCG